MDITDAENEELPNYLRFISAAEHSIPPDGGQHISPFQEDVAHSVELTGDCLLV